MFRLPDSWAGVTWAEAVVERQSRVVTVSKNENFMETSSGVGDVSVRRPRFRKDLWDLKKVPEGDQSSS